MASGGCQNPSLTYMALSARAAHHAAEFLKGGQDLTGAGARHRRVRPGGSRRPQMADAAPFDRRGTRIWLGQVGRRRNVRRRAGGHKQAELTALGLILTKHR